MIVVHDTAAELLADHATIKRALEMLAALENLRVVVIVNGVPFEGAIQYAEGNAVVEITVTV